jgi:hypothetical protein
MIRCATARVLGALLPVLATLAMADASAASPDELLQAYAAQAKKEDPAFQGFSASAGDKLYHAGCARCHADNPRGAGKHEKTGKEIAALAPSVNKARFADAATVEKWFRRNCQDVLARACTAREKGDFISYVLSAK